MEPWLIGVITKPFWVLGLFCIAAIGAWLVKKYMKPGRLKAILLEDQFK